MNVMKFYVDGTYEKNKLYKLKINGTVNSEIIEQVYDVKFTNFSLIDNKPMFNVSDEILKIIINFKYSHNDNVWIMNSNLVANELFIFDENDTRFEITKIEHVMLQEPLYKNELKSDEIDYSDIIFKNNVICDIVNVDKCLYPANEICFYKYDTDIEDLNGLHTTVLKPYSKYYQVESHQDMINFNINYTTISDDMIISSLLSNSNVNIINTVLAKIDLYATKKYDDSFTKCDKILKFIYNIFKKKYVKSVNVKNKVENVVSEILIKSNKISYDGKNGGANICIVGPQLVSFLMKSEMFKTVSKEELFKHKDDKGLTVMNLIYVGKLTNIKIYVNNNLNYDDKSITLLRSPKEPEPGFYLRYLSSKTHTTTNPNTVDEKTLILDNRYAVIDFESYNTLDKFYIRNLKY
jgi:hypothetical protein